MIDFQKDVYKRQSWHSSMTGRKTQKVRENNYGLHEQFTGILHETQP